MNRSLITLAAIALVAFFIPGCEKGNDYVVHPGSPELKNCPILRIIRNRSGTIDTLVFSYNSWGDPLSVTKLPHTNTGSPNYTFKYDKKHRLTEIIGMYDINNSGEVWHKYFYDDASGNITRDSSYVFFGTKDGALTTYVMSSLAFINYDKYGRIVKDSMIHQIYNIFTTILHTYTYNADGNLTGSTYDDKVSILRTNKIWMFYNRNYSVNNAFVADVYNSKGLPVQLNIPIKDRPMSILGEGANDAQIMYGCR